MLTASRRGLVIFVSSPLARVRVVRWDAFLEQASLIIDAGGGTAMQNSQP